MSSDQGYDDEYDDEYDDDDEESKPRRTDSEWAELRRAKKAREKAEKELATLKRQLAFRDAGIDPNDARLSYFVKGYEGESTAEAIRAEAIKAGFISEQVEEPDAQPLEGQARVAEAGNGAEEVTGSVVAGVEAAYQENGTEGMLRYLAEQGVPIVNSQQ